MSIAENTCEGQGTSALTAKACLDEPLANRAQGESPAGTFAEMFHELFQYRDLLWQMVLRDLRIRYKQAVMGLGWALCMPVLIVGSGFIVKYAMAQMSGEPMARGALAAMTVKALGWAFFVGAVGFAVNSLIGNMNLVTKIYFPREMFPLSAVVTQMMDSALGGSVMAVVLFAVLGVGLSPQLLWVPPLLVLLVLTTTAACLLFSCANVFFRDVKYLVQVLLMFGIFFTPVFYEPQLLGPSGCSLSMLNPLAPLLEGLRLAAIEHHDLLRPLVVVSPAGQEVLAWTPWYLLYAAVWSIAGVFGAWWTFHKLEFTFAEYI